jgi:hypothetical protein
MELVSSVCHGAFGQFKCHLSLRVLLSYTLLLKVNDTGLLSVLLQGDVVSIATRLRAGRSGVRNPADAKNFYHVKIA